MIKHKYIDILVMIFVIFSLIITVGLMLPGHWGITPAYQLPAYASKLFDQSYVHTIDIQLENPQKFFDQAQAKEYHVSSITLDGETFDMVGLRVKGNNSLELIDRYESDRLV